MSVNIFTKIAASATLALALAGCVDVSIDIAVTGKDMAKVTTVQVMTADVYSMVKMSAESGETSDGAFCDEGELVENADGSATCTLVEEGSFAKLSMAPKDGEGGMTFTEAGPGLVRVALPTADMKTELGADEEMDEQTRQMATAFFEGHSVTISVTGAEIVETNMTRSADGKKASHEIPLLDLINGTLELPDELFAVVRTP